MSLSEREGSDIFSLDSLGSKGIGEEDILRIHILWVGNAMSRIFESGYKPNNIMTFYVAVDALESVLIDKTEKDDNYKKFIAKFKSQVNGIYSVASKAQIDQKGFELYEKIKDKYRELLKVAYKEHMEDPTSDPLK